jgi:YkoY family integral membrane protein
MADQWNDLLEMLSVNPLHAIFLILGILLLEIILSFDNAAVLATMVKDLPEKQQSQALRYGIIGAYIFRGVALVLVEQILSIWWLKPIGGLYLLWMAFSHFVQKSKDEASEEVQEVKKNLLYRTTVGWIGVFWSTVIAVEFMDIVFSIDNIFAVVAYTPNIFLICAGVFIGILAMRYVAKYFVVLMEKYPYLEKSAFIVIGILGVKLCFALLVRFNKEQFEWIESEAFDLFISVLTLLIFALPILSARITSKKK